MVETTVVRTIRVKGTSEGIEKLTGDLNKLAGAQENVAVVSEQSAKRTLSVQDAWKRQTMQVDESARSQARIARETKVADAALRENLINQQQHAARLELITQRYGVAAQATQKFGTQTGLARHELINLGRQAQDIGVSLASGQSPLMVLMQQGTQVADVFATSGGTVRGFFSQAVGWAGRFAASTAGVVTGIGAIAAGASFLASAWQDSQREIERALIGIGRQSGVTVKDINAIAQGGATATGLSVDQARAAALEFVKTGAIFRDNIRAAVDVTHNFSIVTGKNATEAAKELGAALADPVAGADALNRQLGFLDGRTRQYIATLVSQNQNQEAQAVLLRNLAPAIQNATNTLGPFEKAWDAVANAAIRAKNAIGQALTAPTDQETLDKLLTRGQELRSAPPRPEALAAQGQRFNAGELQRNKADVEALTEAMREAARAKALAFDEFRIPSLKADEAVRELLPYVDALQKVQQQRATLRAAMQSPGIRERQGLADQLENADNAAALLEQRIQSVAAQTERANAAALQLTQSFGTTSNEAAKTLLALQGQLAVAQAGIGLSQVEAQIAQINKQHQVEIYNLRRLGLATTENIAAVDLRRSIALAQVAQQQAEMVRQGEKMLQDLELQNKLIHASSDLQRDRIEAERTYLRLVDQVGEALARQIADQELANRRAQREKNEEEDAVKSAATETERAAAAARENARAVAEAVAAWNKIVEKNRELYAIWQYIPFAIRSATETATPLELLSTKVFQTPSGQMSQFDPAGYKSSFLTPAGQFALNTYGQGGYDPNTGAPNAQGIANMVNNYLSGGRGSMATYRWMQGGGIAGAIEGLLGGGATPEALQVVQQLTNLLPKEQQAGVIERELALLRAQPQTIEREQMIQQLTQTLDQLRQSTDNLNGTMQQVLSEYYTSDPRTSHLGFRTFAQGGIMTAQGEVPLKTYQLGGIVRTPQVAIYGEGSTPEAIVPIPNGHIPVRIMGAANSNERAIIANISVNVPSGNRQDLKRGAQIMAQELTRAMASAR